MRKITIEISDKDAEWLEKNADAGIWLYRHGRIPNAAGAEKRVIVKVLQALKGG